MDVLISFSINSNYARNFPLQLDKNAKEWKKKTWAEYANKGTDVKPAAAFSFYYDISLIVYEAKPDIEMTNDGKTACSPPLFLRTPTVTVRVTEINESPIVRSATTLRAPGSTQGLSQWPHCLIIIQMKQYLYIYMITCDITRWQILANNQLDALFHVFIYFISLHVSSITMLIIRRSNCINTSSGMISLCKWLLGMLASWHIANILTIHNLS